MRHIPATLTSTLQTKIGVLTPGIPVAVTKIVDKTHAQICLIPHLRGIDKCHLATVSTNRLQFAKRL